MRLRRIVGTGACALLVSLAVAQQSEKLHFYVDGYADAGWAKLTGSWTSQIIRLGLRQGPFDVFVYARNEDYDTEGTALPYQYIDRGLSVGVGARFWLGPDIYALVSNGQWIAGANQGDQDFRAGFAGYKDWQENDSLVDVYGDLFYIGFAEDTYLDLRVRDGRILNIDANKNRTWIYTILQGYASASGANATDNRIEAGIGAGYVFGKGHLTLNAELREGYSFRGTGITGPDRTYFNPIVYIAGNL
jgi:hypothetical protein